MTSAQGRQGGGPGGRRNRKVVKRMLCPEINQHIMEAAKDGNIETLLCAIGECLQDMNLVNLTTSLHRLAKLCSDKPEARSLLYQNGHHQLLDQLLSAISATLLKTDSLGVNDSRRQALSNIVWSLGMLRCVKLDLVHILVGLTYEQLSDFKPFELASTVWAFAKLGSLHAGVREMTMQFQTASIAPVMAVAHKLGFRFLAMVAWAFAVTGNRDERIFCTLGGRMLPMLRRGEPASDILVDLSVAFGSSGFRYEQVLIEVITRSRRQIDAFDAQQLAELSVALAGEGLAGPDFFAAVGRRALKLDMPPTLLATVACAACRAALSWKPRAGSSAPFSSAFLSPLLTACGQRLDLLEPTHVAPLLWAVAQCLHKDFERNPDCTTAKEALGFFSVAAEGLPHMLASLQGQPLAVTILAFWVAPISIFPALHDMIAHQIFAKMSTLGPAELVQMLQCVPFNWSSNYRSAASALALECARRIVEFPGADVVRLAAVCGVHLGLDLSACTREQVAGYCRLLARQNQALPPLPAPATVELRRAPENTSPRSHAALDPMPAVAEEDEEGSEFEGDCGAAPANRLLYSLASTFGETPTTEGSPATGSDAVVSHIDHSPGRAGVAESSEMSGAGSEMPFAWSEAEAVSSEEPKLMSVKFLGVDESTDEEVVGVSDAESEEEPRTRRGRRAATDFVGIFSPGSDTDEESRSNFRFAVKNTFLELDDDLLADDGIRSSLPPAMDCALVATTEEALLKIRVRYQKSRIW